ncbi:HEPN domain-containing protein [Phormidesmis sp. 146-12]
MSFDWTSYLTVAQALFDEAELCRDNPAKLLLCEAQYRCCVSRSYYSAFCSARNYLINIEKNVELTECKDSSVHATVIRVFQEKGKRNGNCLTIANILKRLRLDRNSADYNDEWKELKPLSSQAKIVLKDALCVLKLLQKL